MYITDFTEFLFNTCFVTNISHFRLTKSLRQRLVSPYNLERVKSIAWGINHEDEAIKQYVALGAVVQKTGGYFCYHYQYFPNMCMFVALSTT